MTNKGTLIKADLHCHGLIGFHKPWFEVQGYDPRNIGGKIIDSAIENCIDLVGLVSEQYEIPKGSVHDRFNYLFDNLKQNKDYKVDKIDKKDIAFVARRKEDGGLVTVLNSQMVITNYDGGEVRYLAIGSNQVPNQEDYIETLRKGHSEGLLQLMSHRHLLTEGLEYFDAVEGHDAQNRWANFFGSIPKIGSKIGQITKKLNDDAQKFASEHGKPWISVSNAHTPESVGKASIDIYDNLPLDSGEDLLALVKECLSDSQFTENSGYENPRTGFTWMAQFEMNKHKRF